VRDGEIQESVVKQAVILLSAFNDIKLLTSNEII
jgi:hypothetical protein